MRAIIFVNEDIAEICKDAVISDDARKTNLLISIIQTKDERVCNCTFGALARPSLRPISTREKINDGVHIQPRGVCADGEIFTIDFNDLGHGVSLSRVILSLSLRART